MVKLKEQGKISAIGISVVDRRASEANSHIEAGRLDVVQVVYNILEQEPEYTLFPMAQKHLFGIAPVSSSLRSLPGAIKHRSLFLSSPGEPLTTNNACISRLALS